MGVGVGGRGVRRRRRRVGVSEEEGALSGAGRAALVLRVEKVSPRGPSPAATVKKKKWTSRYLVWWVFGLCLWDD